MFKRILSLLLAALFIIAPLSAMALTESDWNKGCRFKTNTEVTLYTRTTDGKVNTFDAFGSLQLHQRGIHRDRRQTPDQLLL